MSTATIRRIRIGSSGDNLELTPPATHLRVRGDERRLASAPERAVPSHRHIEHQLKFKLNCQ